ncbi:MAG: zf-HC2 domain-containing protein [Candidatus Latescibacterota bacterium]|nr:MAG: zf-HC2 domain-containing protein [Candidatus Latescibacterota bacterium]
MKCRQAKKLIFDFIDGEISDQDRLVLEQHLSECTSCETMASGLSDSLRLLHRIPPVEPDENFNWKLRLRLAKEKHALQTSAPSERSWLRAWNTRFALSALSTFVLVLAVGFVLMRSVFEPVGGTGEFELKPSAMPRVSTTTESGRLTQPSGEGVLYGRGMFRPVIYGDQPVGPPVAKTTDPLLDVDSLMARYLRSRMEGYRVQLLERQVEALQTELQKCNPEQD